MMIKMIRERDGGTNFIIRIKEKSTRIKLRLYDDDDDDDEDDDDDVPRKRWWAKFILRIKEHKMPNTSGK